MSTCSGVHYDQKTNNQSHRDKSCPSDPQAVQLEKLETRNRVSWNRCVLCSDYTVVSAVDTPALMFVTK
ncbi:hypothetical protein RRG08_025648 [Elysia crispata]|uniref:Uncharacterized protein n=1 Tax=Elysia crispata TaxID=231223 RepID=A0AAE1CX26_9GAST|nr:hypothetical protein RRG08_025648 [Elysia crispata]